MYQSQLGQIFFFLKVTLCSISGFWIPWILLLFSADGRRITWAVRGFRRTHFVCHYMRKGVFFFFQMFMGTAVRARARYVLLLQHRSLFGLVRSACGEFR